MKNLFAKKLKELRQEKLLSQSDISKEFNVSKQTVSAWKKGLQETDFDTLIKIVKF